MPTRFGRKLPGMPTGLRNGSASSGNMACLGIAVGPAEPARGESILDRLQDGFIGEEPQAVDLRDGCRSDVIGISARIP